jgi:hypothetical protein
MTCGIPDYEEPPDAAFLIHENCIVTPVKEEE